MPSPEETRAMQAILDKLNSATTQAPVVSESTRTQHNYAQQATGNVSPDAQEMFNILAKLEAAKEQVAEEISHSPEPMLTETKEANHFGVAGYNVEIVEGKLAGKYKKKYYTVTKGDQIVYKELALFESAMAIVKELTHKKDVYKVQRIAKLDSQYDEYLNEAAVHKNRVNTLTESVQADVAAAKHSGAVSKMNEIKREIKKLL